MVFPPLCPPFLRIPLTPETTWEPGTNAFPSSGNRSTGSLLLFFLSPVASYAGMRLPVSPPNPVFFASLSFHRASSFYSSVFMEGIVFLALGPRLSSFLSLPFLFLVLIAALTFAGPPLPSSWSPVAFLPAFLDLDSEKKFLRALFSTPPFSGFLCFRRCFFAAGMPWTPLASFDPSFSLWSFCPVGSPRFLLRRQGGRVPEVQQGSCRAPRRCCHRNDRVRSSSPTTPTFFVPFFSFCLEGLLISAGW